jgi:N-glycosylase/DNA lyase
LAGLIIFEPVTRVKRQPEPVTIERIKQVHNERSGAIRQRLVEFEGVLRRGSDAEIWEEMVFCFFTGGCSARMGLRSIEAVRPHLAEGNWETVRDALSGVHRYPNARSRYVVESREFLENSIGFRIRAKLESFDCHLERRDWLVKEKGIKGLGYKEASHFLRNIGYKGYAILDKHVLRCLAELKIINDPKPPNTRSKYLSVENRLKTFTESIGIDFDEMDLVLWSMKTGEILK